MTGRVHLRCPSTDWGVAVDAAGTWEKRCRGKLCRTSDGQAVIHVFDLATGSFTARKEAPRAQTQEQDHGRHTTSRHR